MRTFFKVLLFPISLILTIFVAVSSFLVEKCAIVLNIFSGLFFLGSVLVFLQYFFGWPFSTAGNKNDLYFGIIGVVIAFVLSPYGLPSILARFIGLMDRLNTNIKSI